MCGMKLILILFVSLLTFSLCLSDVTATSVYNTDTPPKKLVLIGDSITKSFYGSLYINNLSTMPYWANLSIINSGIAGCSVKSYYKSEYLVNNRVSQYEPDFVLVFLGLADAAWYNEVGTFEIEYRWLIDTIIQQNNNSQLLLVKFSWANSVITPFMESHVKVIEKIAREYQLPYSDVYRHTKDHKEWLFDGAHPNVIGAYEIASCLSKDFTSFINGSLKSPVNYSASLSPEASTSIEASSTYLYFWIVGLFTIVIIRKRKFKV